MKVVVLLCLAFAFAAALPGRTKPAPNRRIVEAEYDPYRIKYLAVRDENGKLRVENLMKEYVGPKAEISDVTFRLTNRGNRGSYETLHCNNFNELVSSSVYDKSLPNYFIVHGWSSSADSSLNSLIRNAVLAVTDANVFVVDWSGPAGEFYTGAKSAVPHIGKYVGEYINKMMSEFGLSAADFRLAGHSLGAHVVGCAGAAVNGKVHYIVGLDPAGPLFSLSETDNRIDETDGNHVQIIHTNGGLLGMDSSIGHADFYPNGGGSQPGCGIDLTGSCAHGRSYEYLAESIKSSGFLATKCGSYNDWESGHCNGNKQVYMGQFEVNSGASGDYFLDTNDESPYALN